MTIDWMRGRNAGWPQLCATHLVGPFLRRSCALPSLLVMTHPGTAFPGPVDKVDAVDLDPPKIHFWEALAVLLQDEPPITTGTSGDSFETTQRGSLACPNRT